MTSLAINQVIFNPSNPDTDFKTIITKNPSESLFLYNENFDHFENKDYLAPGGGNAFLRKYRQDTSKPSTEVYSLGIPTGNYHFESDKDYLKLVDESIDQIRKYVKNNRHIKNIYYSSNESGELGLGIFAKEKWTRENIGYIREQLSKLFEELKKEYTISFNLIM